MAPLVRVLAEDAKLRELAIGAVEAMAPSADLQPDPPAGGSRLLDRVRRLRQAMARGQEPVPALLVVAADQDRIRPDVLVRALQPSGPSEPPVPWHPQPVVCTPRPCVERWILLDAGCLREGTGADLLQQYAVPKAKQCLPYKDLLGTLLAGLDAPSDPLALARRTGACLASARPSRWRHRARDLEDFLSNLRSALAALGL